MKLLSAIDIRNWGVDQLDEVSRREIYVAGDDGPSITRIS